MGPGSGVLARGPCRLWVSRAPDWTADWTWGRKVFLKKTELGGFRLERGVVTFPPICLKIDACSNRAPVLLACSTPSLSPSSESCWSLSSDFCSCRLVLRRTHSGSHLPQGLSSGGCPAWAIPLHPVPSPPIHPSRPLRSPLPSLTTTAHPLPFRWWNHII